jgi:hypothetical protein
MEGSEPQGGAKQHASEPDAPATIGGSNTTMGLEATVQKVLSPQKPVQGPIRAGKAVSRASTNKASSMKAVSLEKVLAGEVGRAIGAQAQSQQKERQKDLGLVWDCFVKELELRDERLRILEERYEARTAGLENEVSRLRDQLTGDAQDSTQKRKDGPGSLGDRSQVIQAQKDEAQLSDPRNEPQVAKCPQLAQNTNAPATAKAAQKTITVNKTYADTAAVPAVMGGEWHKVTGKSEKRKRLRSSCRRRV